MNWRKRSGLLFGLAFRPVDALGLQRFAHAVSDGQAAGGRGDDGELGDHGADFGIGAQQAAQPDAQRFRVLVIAHGERDLQVFVRVQAVGINKMAIAQSAGVAENAHNFIVSRQQVHRVAGDEVAFQRIEEMEADLLQRLERGHAGARMWVSGA